MKLINIGYGNSIADNRIIAVISPDSSPVKRIIADAREKGFLVDATYGRKTKSVIVTDSSHVVLSAVSPETISGRINENIGE
ncbi:MAG: DUF370 domain-containing protein [Clostridia bacterium]|jgi:regulator of extracellular matrix RemA (YlzA/DUF370 family)|nr:DUF370 domain-containing protein [Clostridia bacterium]MBQ6172107.1 DUF370 domain-containing protein [Clostridia bacterium]